MRLQNLEREIKLFLAVFLTVLTIGVTVGLIYVYTTTTISTTGIADHYAGSEIKDEFDIPVDYPKPFSELLLTTHNHVITFSIIFFILGSLFYYNSTIVGKWKLILIIEPLISTLLTFGSLWGIRFFSKSFVWLTVGSSILLYISFYIMAIIVLYELLSKKPV